MSRLETEYETVVADLGDPDTSADPTRLRNPSRRRKDLEEVVGVWRDLKSARDDVEAAHEMSEEATGEDRDMVRAELETSEAAVESLEERLRGLLLPKDPNDGRNVIVEIRGAEGGEEANLFARDLFDMYQRYADRRGWKVEVLSAQASDLGGLDEATFVVRGEDAWQRL